MLVTLTDQAADEASQLPKAIRARILKIVDRLAFWPDVSGAKPLRANLAGHYRIRTGDYRLQFRVSDDLIIIEKIGHRDGFYED
ncbi:MAG: type II toxin-antitoxin system RelE/ParE family toxin [Planctomycetia bacterium]|nr:type II toxin-antitoxin system RelE/ParE family toxin [Planctomycetia bacterium]